MKEANPVGIRVGVSEIWQHAVRPVFYNKSLFEQIRFNTFIVRYLDNWCYYAVVNPLLLTLPDKLYIYFYFYPTQLTFRLRAKRWISYIEKKQKNLQKEFFEFYPQKNTSPYYFFFERRGWRKKRKTLVFFKRDIRHFCLIRLKSVRLPLQIRFIKINNKKLQQNKKISKRKKYRKQSSINLIKLLKLRVMVRFRVGFERLLERIFKKPTKVFVSDTYVILKSQSRLVVYTWYLHKKYFYYQSAINFIDSLNVSMLSILYHDPNLLVLFICREFERARYHNKLLKMLRSIATELYNTGLYIAGFRILAKGPINKHSRTKTMNFQLGHVRRPTFSNLIKHKRFFARTIFGVVGVRIWIL